MPRIAKRCGQQVHLGSGATANSPARSSIYLSDTSTPDLERLRLLGEITPGIAHDMRNMLNVVVGGAQAARRAAPADAARFLDAVASAACRAGELAELLLRAWHPSDATSSEERPLLNPRTCLLGNELLFARLTPAGVDLRLRLDADLRPVRVSAAEFESAVLNLLTNARDAMLSASKAGTVTVLAQNHQIRSTGKRLAQYLRISVVDTGPGMDRATLARAGEPFFTTKGVRGTGLGLHQVRRFAEEAGGWMEVLSVPELGTTVHLYLPQPVAAGSDTPRPTEADRRRGPGDTGADCE